MPECSAEERAVLDALAKATSWDAFRWGAGIHIDFDLREEADKFSSALFDLRASLSRSAAGSEGEAEGRKR